MKLWILAAVIGLIITAMNSQAQEGPNATVGAPSAMEVQRDGSGKVTGTTKHFEAVVPKITLKVLSPSETAARGGAYQESLSYASGYNHDGLAFLDLSSALDTAVSAHAGEIKKAYQNLTNDGTPFAFAQSDLTEYHKNIKSGKWHKLVNGQVCKYRTLFKMGFGYIELNKLFAPLDFPRPGEVCQEGSFCSKFRAAEICSLGPGIVFPVDDDEITKVLVREISE